jgi:hypothetical protein
MKYREEPSTLLFIKGLPERACQVHIELLNRLEKYYRDFEDLNKLRAEQFSAPAEEKGATRIDPAQIDFRIRSAKVACDEVLTTWNLIEKGDISSKKGLGLMVMSLEQSLQHLHKLILLYPPAARAGGEN